MQISCPETLEIDDDQQQTPMTRDNKPEGEEETKQDTNSIQLDRRRKQMMEEGHRDNDQDHGENDNNDGNKELEPSKASQHRAFVARAFCLSAKSNVTIESRGTDVIGKAWARTRTTDFEGYHW